MAVPTSFDESDAVLEFQGIEGSVGPQAVSAKHGHLANGGLCTLTCWKLEPGEAETIAKTGRIWVFIATSPADGGRVAGMVVQAETPDFDGRKVGRE